MRESMEIYPGTAEERQPARNRAGLPCLREGS